MNEVKKLTLKTKNLEAEIQAVLNSGRQPTLAELAALERLLPVAKEFLAAIDGKPRLRVVSQ